MYTKTWIHVHMTHANACLQTQAHGHKYTFRQTEKSYQEAKWGASLKHSVHITEKNSFKETGLFFSHVHNALASGVAS